MGTRQSTPEAVEQAALDVFAEKGFENTTVEDVALAGGISRRTFFRYFTSKADIPWSGFDTLLDRLRAWPAEMPDDVAIFDAVLGPPSASTASGPTDRSRTARATLVLHTPSSRPTPRCGGPVALGRD